MASNSTQSSDLTAVMQKALTALDTAAGVCQLVDIDRKPVDLAECYDEINAARADLARALGHDEG